VKVGVIGLGYWGPNLVRNFATLEGVEVAAVADKDPSRVERVRRLYPYVEPFDDGFELIERGGVDAVAIVTPVATHFPLALAALQNGKHVLVEKPLTDNPNTAEQLCKEAEKRALVLMVDHVFVYSGPVERLKEIIDAGELGDVVYFDSVRINLGLFRHDVNVIWDLAAHDFSILDWLFGGKEPQILSAVGLALPQFDTECTAYITLKYPNGALGSVHVSWFAPVKIRRFILSGTKKMVLYDDLDPYARIKVFDKGVEFIEDPDSIYKVIVSYRTGEMYAPILDATEPLHKVCKGFLAAVKEGAVPRSDAASALRVTKALYSANRLMTKKGAYLE